MWSSPLLALLLFTVVALVSARSPSTVSNRTLPYPRPSRSPQANTPLMEELLGDGGKRTIKSWNGRYLSYEPVPGYKPDPAYTVSGSPGEREYWTIEQINDYEVVLKSHHGKFIRHYHAHAANLAPVADAWEMLTPVKNADGTWSFRSRYKRWLSAYRRNHVDFQPDNLGCERWRLE